MKKLFLLSLITIFCCSYNFAQGPFFTQNCVSTGSPKYSSALNYQTTASGNYSFASGYLTIASGNNSCAINSENTASGSSSFAAGWRSKATGLNSIALGEECTTYHQSYAIGQKAEAISNLSFAFGRYVRASASAEGAMVIGSSNSALGYLVNNKSNSLMIGFSSSPIFFANATSIGIATTNPLYTLDVNGSSLFRNEVRIASLVSPKGKRIVLKS